MTGSLVDGVERDGRCASEEAASGQVFRLILKAGMELC